ncbi:MAG: tRNA (N6-threonylcarbamoyladenosine(37)-N6)-methyltransferase TrmO [Gammaproteobacteria bacterium]
MSDDTLFTPRPIARIRTPFGGKFGTPRQSGLVPSAQGWVELLAPYNRPEALDGLEGFSHLWLIWVFHEAVRDDWSPTVRPPRLGGNERMGVFATRSPFRPNPIGLSVVELLELDAARSRFRVGGVDISDGTPILDIKPYVPYADALPDARAGFASEAPDARLEVHFSPAARAVLDTSPHLEPLIRQTLALDPRPAYQRTPGRVYA